MSQTLSARSKPLTRVRRGMRKHAAFGLGDVFRKSLSARNLRFLLAQHVLGHIPGIGRHWNLPVGRVDPAEIATDIGETSSSERIPVDTAAAKHLAAYPGWDETPSTITLDRRLQTVILPSIRLLSGAPQILHRPTRRMVLPNGWKVERSDVQPARTHTVKRVPDTSVPLLSSATGHGHYFHFFFDRVVPLMVRRDHPALTGELRLLVRDRRPAFQEPAIDHLLTILPHASLVPVGRGEALDCDMLFHTFDQRARPIDHFAFGNAIRALGPIYRERYGVNIARTSRRLYLSRANQKSRRMVNEGEVERTLERHGFESIRPEELSHPEQVALFAEASDIVATTGAALTNLLFCQPGTRVIEIRPSDFRYPLWLGLCLQMGHEHRGLIGSATDIHRDLLVDTAELEREIASFAG